MNAVLHFDAGPATGDKVVLRLAGDFTIYEAAQRQQELQGALQATPHLALDLNGVGEIDGCGLQLLLATGRAARHAGGTLEIVASSAAVRDALALVQLDACLQHRATS